MSSRPRRGAVDCRLMKTSLLLALVACAPVIPQRTLAQRMQLPADLPPLAPCALVHLTAEENLSNAARGFFRGSFQLSYTTFLIRHPRGIVLIDAAWVKEGFEEPVPKGRLASLFADSDRDQAAQTLGLLHAVFAAHAASVVTSHDERSWTDIGRCGK